MSRVMGFLNIDKPLGMTSHDVVAQIRRRLKRDTGQKKVGHAGTLDPLATGVLVLCLGDATRLSEYVMASQKRYLARVHLGVETDTYDAEGSIVSENSIDHINQSDVEGVLEQLIGDIEQIPPMYSAIKQGGKKLYELARSGQIVERPARSVTISSLQITNWSPPIVELDVVCSSGTYIRSLAYDIGQELGVGAHLVGLIRTASGDFKIENSHVLDDLLESDDWQRHIIKPYDGLRSWQSIELTESHSEELQFGRTIQLDVTFDQDVIMGYMSDGHLLAVLERRGQTWKPHKVFLPDR